MDPPHKGVTTTTTPDGNYYLNDFCLHAIELWTGGRAVACVDLGQGKELVLKIGSKFWVSL